jgi:hypothetical protein
MTVTVPGEGGTDVIGPERNRSPVGPEFATCRVATPGGGGVAEAKLNRKGAAVDAVAVSVAGPGTTVVKTPLRAGPTPMNPPTSMGNRSTM